MDQALRIRGVLSPVVTPFTRDLRPDPERFIAHCRWLLSQGCGLAVFGTNSEANSLSVDERIALLDTLLSAGLDPLHMMPGTGCCALTDSVRLTAHAVKAGCARSGTPLWSAELASARRTLDSVSTDLARRILWS